MKRILVVIDMQNDFITGALPADGGIEIVPHIVKKIKNGGYNKVLYTRDFHRKGTYHETLEGDLIPGHCFNGTEGVELVDEIYATRTDIGVEVYKETFGSFDLPDMINYYSDEEDVEIELCGVCTDICVISNALILRAAFPNTRIIVDASCCAGTTKENHEAALKVMRNCLIEVI